LGGYPPEAIMISGIDITKQAERSTYLGADWIQSLFSWFSLQWVFWSWLERCW
jgi:hypothetical protein